MRRRLDIASGMGRVGRRNAETAETERTGFGVRTRIRTLTPPLLRSCASAAISDLPPRPHSARPDNAADACGQERHLEVDQESQRLSVRLEVRDELGNVDGKNLWYGLQLHDEVPADNHVQPRLTDHLTLVENLDGNLPLKRNPTTYQLDAECLLVYRLEKPGAENAVDLDCGANDFAGDEVELLPGLGQLGVHTDSSDESSRSFHLSRPGKGGAAEDVWADYGAPPEWSKPCPPFADTRITDEWRSQCVKQ